MAGTKKIYSDLFISGIFNNNGLVFPTVDGISGQTLTTDGGGALYWSTVSGGTGSGSTSPGGNDGDVQFNNGGSFDGVTTFNYSTSDANLYFQGDESGKSSTLNIGQLDGNPFNLTGTTRGTSLVYNNSASGMSANTIFIMGDLGDIIGDNSTILGYYDSTTENGNMLLTSPKFMSLVASDNPYQSSINLTGRRGVYIQAYDNESGTTHGTISIDPVRGIMLSTFEDNGNVQVQTTFDPSAGIDINLNSAHTFTINEGFSQIFSLDTSGKVRINDNYTFPTVDGNNGQVMQTDGGGNLSWASVSGGTGSTSPGGSDGDVQFNNGSGGFDASSDFNWDGGDGILKVVSSANSVTNTFSVGSLVTPSVSASGLTSMVYNNPLSGSNRYTLFSQGNLTGIGQEDYGTLIGNIDMGSSEGSNLILNNSSAIMAFSDGTYAENTWFQLNHLAGIKAALPESGGDTSFFVEDSNGESQFEVSSSGSVRINAAYRLPTSDGSNGQVMQTDGSGQASWGAASIMGGGGGLCSTKRVGVGNTVSGDYSAAMAGQNNTASNYHSFVGGGRNNTASNIYATVSGGYLNTADASGSTIGGGFTNTASDKYSTVAGGYANTASGQYSTIAGGGQNTANSEAATISGGYGNVADCDRSTIGGGYCNTVSACYATIGGGYQNCASGASVTIAGGRNNCAFGCRSTISGGYYNVASGETATVGGGECNQANCNYSTVSGGYCNLSNGSRTTIGGGVCNTASGEYSGILGGRNNIVTGLTNGESFIVGANITANRPCTTFMNNISIMDIPTSAAGLPSGSVWRSGATLQIVI